MRETYEMVVGLEVHAELKTATKIFCDCENAYGAPPNTRVCPICLGLPGVLPRLNRRAVELGIAAGLATDCTVERRSRFDRKNYFYPDLPKGYQITQYEHPLCRNGYIEVETEAGIRRIGILRMHLEEDAGKLLHGEDGTRVDYNRCGVPLIEIVSAPDMHSSAEARAYLAALRERLLFAGVSDCRMNEGSLRCDVNLSVRRRGDVRLGERTEIKNLNSIAFVGKAIDYEFARQVDILEAGGTIVPQTRRYDESSGRTVRMREKETAADYRYLPEPDLAPLILREADIESVQQSLPVPPHIRRARYVADYGISADAARLLTAHPQTAAYFEEAAARTRFPKTAADLLIGEVLPKSLSTPAAALAVIADMVGAREISAASARKLLPLSTAFEDPRKIAEERHMLLITDADALAALVRKAIEANEEAARQLLAGNEKARQTLLGYIMRISCGCADPAGSMRQIDAWLHDTK